MSDAVTLEQLFRAGLAISVNRSTEDVREQQRRPIRRHRDVRE